MRAVLLASIPPFGKRHSGNSSEKNISGGGRCDEQFMRSVNFLAPNNRIPAVIFLSLTEMNQAARWRLLNLVGCVNVTFTTTTFPQLSGGCKTALPQGGGM
jgi:hypothetical protein